MVEGALYWPRGAKIEPGAVNHRNIAGRQCGFVAGQVPVGIDPQMVFADVAAVIEAEIAVMAEIQQSGRIRGGGKRHPESCLVIRFCNAVGACYLHRAGKTHMPVRIGQAEAGMRRPGIEYPPVSGPETVAAAMKYVTTIAVAVEPVELAVDQGAGTADPVDHASDSGAMEPAMHEVVVNAVEPQHKRDVTAIVGRVEPQVLQRRAP